MTKYYIIITSKEIHGKPPIQPQRGWFLNIFLHWKSAKNSAKTQIVKISHLNMFITSDKIEENEYN